jgi:two-component system, cell cycle response regulator
MTKPHKIALLGFSSFERSTFESFFRLAARRAPGYEVVTEVASAAMVIINSDDTEVLKNFKPHSAQKTMLVGHSDGGTGWPLQQRPIKLMAVLTQVDQTLNPVVPTLQVPRSNAAPATPVRAQPAAPSVVPMPAPEISAKLARSVREGSGTSAATRSDAAPMLGLETQPPSNTPDAFDDILVVDDSDIALKFMQNRLQRFGFRAHLVRSGEEALSRLTQQPYKFVFLDVMMDGLDGYQTCRAIKQRKYSSGKPPVVVMLTSRGGTIDKIRGTLAGCDAYLTKPLNETELIKVLAKHDASIERGFRSTAIGQSGFAVSSKASSSAKP